MTTSLLDILGTYCPNCLKVTRIVTEFRQGTSLCSECGRVIEDRIIDFTEETRKFSNENGSENNRSRLNGGFRNDNVADGGLSLSISGSTSTLGRMAERLGVTSQEASLVKANRLIKEWAGLLNITSKFQRRAQEQFSKLVAQVDNLKGYGIEGLSAAVLYIVCKDLERPFQAKQIADVSGVRAEELKRGYKHAKKYIEVGSYVDECKYTHILCKSIGANQTVSWASLKISEKIKEIGLLEGKNPKTCAAVAVFVAMKLTADSKTTFKELVEKAGVSEATIKKAIKVVDSSLKEIVPEWENRLPLENARI